MISEKALVRLMKDAHGGGGVKVWRLGYDHRNHRADENGADSLLINSGFWAALAPMERVPSKALAVLVEWNRRLPYCGEAMQLLKKAEPMPLEEGTRGENVIETVPSNDKSSGCKMTRFVLEDKRVFQLYDLSFVIVADELLTLLESRRNLPQIDRDRTCLYWQDPDTDECVWICPRRDVKQQDIARLKLQNFWEENDE